MIPATSNGTSLLSPTQAHWPTSSPTPPAGKSHSGAFSVSGSAMRHRAWTVLGPPLSRDSPRTLASGVNRHSAVPATLFAAHGNLDVARFGREGVVVDSNTIEARR